VFAISDKAVSLTYCKKRLNPLAVKLVKLDFQMVRFSINNK
jgi:hypothetical protein